MDGRTKLRQDLSEWMAKVLAAYDADDFAMSDTLRMVKDVDNIIATAFYHNPVLS